MRYLFAVFMLFISTSTLFAQLTAVKLYDWKHEGLPSSGNWTISEDSTSVRQSKNDVPTFFVSPDTFSNVTIRGSFFVDSSDDDYIGFVFGYLRPDSAEEYFDFYLMDWKGNTQSGAQEGFTLSKVEGIVEVPSGTNTSHPYWDHMDTTQTVLATNYGDNGWARNVVYNFELIYESNRVRISIDTTQIFDVSGEFRAGRFGFYNYSQPGVNYREFRVNEAPLAIDDYYVVDEDSQIAMDVTFNDTDADGHDKMITNVGAATQGNVTFTNGDSLIFYTPALNFNGADSFYYHISDGNGGSDSAKVVITVSPVNDAPQRIALIPDAIIAENSMDVFHVTINDYFSDVDANDSFLSEISISSNGNVNGVVSADSLFLSSSNFSGFDTLLVSVADDSGSVVMDTFVVEVEKATGLEDLNIPVKFSLKQNYPNPFNPTTLIVYSIPKSSDVSLVVYDILGQEVVSLVNKNQKVGTHQVVWNGRDNSNNPVSSGMYFYKIKADNFEQSKKMVLMK
ncbi:MAG: T9SS C-terminal target domain-containing protein [Calditrichaeota bacterium]|nr:MAG: T9SS C-terminal target domain-containing protein [Calditrichota bacterium]MBL1206462.1 T9SS C-terminal target domain-containing protein [Calditrichota bacterium]NOG46289.1 cadherin-like domain-containing protein [Calditrichota bacterium]